MTCSHDMDKTARNLCAYCLNEAELIKGILWQSECAINQVFTWSLSIVSSLVYFARRAVVRRDAGLSYSSTVDSAWSLVSIYGYILAPLPMIGRNTVNSPWSRMPAP